MIFHVYGSHTDYADIIRRTRARTTAEVLIQTDHVTRDEDLTEPTDPATLRPDGKIWNSLMNYLWLPNVARENGAALLDQLDLWKGYLRDNHVHAAQLLKDGVHQNAWGNYVMAELVKPYLVRRNDTPIDPMNCATVKTYVVGKDVKWNKNGRRTLPFDGNRVDLIGTGKSASSILIDGRQPAEIPELYGFTRALATPGGKWPVILKVGSEKRLQPEGWTLTATRDPADPTQYAFTLAGSHTGPDGAGRTDRRFVSTSGRVVIEPADWNIAYSLALTGIKDPPPALNVRWGSVYYGQDNYRPPAQATPGVEPAVTVAQGLAPGAHALEIMGQTSALKAIRIYRPPIREGSGR